MSPEKTWTVLVVDDNVSTRKLICTALARDGYRVLEAVDAHSAFHAVVEERPDLIIQDLFLPDLDGVELLQSIRALPGGADLPILAHSGWVSRMDQARRQGASFTDYLVKPVEVVRLRQTVRSYLAAESPEPPREFAGKTTLVVAQDVVRGKLIEATLAAAGFQVTLAGDGLLALEIARAALPSVVLSDVSLPRLDGYRLCHLIRQDPLLAGIPVVLAHAPTEEGDHERAAEVGANALILQTPDVHDALAALRVALAVGAPPAAADVPIAADESARRIEQQAALNAGLARHLSWLEGQLAARRPPEVRPAGAEPATPESRQRRPRRKTADQSAVTRRPGPRARRRRS